MNPGTRDGFQVVRDRPTVHSSAIDQKTKQALAICHLFLNRNIALADIVRLLEEDNGTVVLALLVMVLPVRRAVRFPPGEAIRYA